MKYIKNEDNNVVILSQKEIQIIGTALNDRMCYLQKKLSTDSAWAKIEWDKCLDLQCQWFKIE